MTGNPPIRIFLNKIESRILFKFKTRYYLELLTPETPFNTLLGSTKNMANKNVPYLEHTGVVLVHFNIIKNDCQHIQESCIYLLPVNNLVNHNIFHQKI